MGRPVRLARGERVDGPGAPIDLDRRLAERATDSPLAVDVTPADGAWLTLARASRYLGVSVDTVRRRAKDGTYRARLERGHSGPAWHVWVDGAQKAAPTVLPPAAASALVAVLERLTDEAVALARRVGTLQAQIEACTGSHRNGQR